MKIEMQSPEDYLPTCYLLNYFNSNYVSAMVSNTLSFLNKVIYRTLKQLHSINLCRHSY